MATILPLKRDVMHGEKNGYTYRFVQAVDNKVCYALTNPTNDGRIVILQSEVELNDFLRDPEEFWQKYVK